MDYKELGLTKEELVEMYRMMRLIRVFEESAVAYFKQGIVIGNMHMYVGEEAVATGVCKALTKEDYIASTHRCDGHLIAKGADINAMMAELMGRENGICAGRAGKMHQNAPERVSVSFFGDGGGNQGAFHEAMNMAALWKLPVIFVCENNHYAISTRVDTATAMGTFYQRAAGYGVPGVRVNGNDVLEVYAAAKEAVARARRGEGPTFIECDTYRLRGHHEGDEQTYRTREEVNEVREHNDCITRMQKLLFADFGWTEDEDQALIKSVDDQVAAAVEFGLKGEPMKVEDMYNNLYVD